MQLSGRNYAISMLLRTYEFSAPDPLAIARAFDISLIEVAARLGLTSDYIRRLAADARHAHRVCRVVLILALERERFAEALL